MHSCPVPDCERNVGIEYLMCRTDWWRVTPATRQRVYDTFGVVGEGRLSEEYREAREQAIAEAVASRARSAAKKEAARG